MATMEAGPDAALGHAVLPAYPTGSWTAQLSGVFLAIPVRHL